MEEGTASSIPSEPPPLPYSLRDRKKSITIFWTIFIIDTLGQPLALYWALWYATDLSHNVGMFEVAVVYLPVLIANASGAFFQSFPLSLRH